MPKSLGGTAQTRANIPLNITHLTSHSDPSVPLVSTFTPAIWHSANSQRRQQPESIARPRPSLQVYYTAPNAADPTRLTSAARALEAEVLAERHEGRDPAECDRLDVYGMPYLDSDSEGVVDACVEHQRREIAERRGDKDWYIQRYDIGGGDWRRALIIVRKRREEWVGAQGQKLEVGLSVVFFDAVNQEDGGGGRDFWERKAGSVEEEEVLIRELGVELNWQHSVSQFI